MLMRDSLIKLSDLQTISSLTDAPRSRGVSVVLLISVIVVLSLICLPAFAHKVNMFAYVEGNKVMMEGYFADGNKPMNCEVVVTDPDKKVLVKGLTDNNGKFSFDVPAVTDLHIVLNAGMGHRTEYVISRNELAGVKPSGTMAVTGSSPPSQEETANTPPTDGDGVSASADVSAAMVRKAVADANLPLMRAMEEMKEGADFRNIVGGIGFIFGIVGVFFYIKARKILLQSSSHSPAGK